MGEKKKEKKKKDEKDEDEDEDNKGKRRKKEKDDEDEDEEDEKKKKKKKGDKEKSKWKVTKKTEIENTEEDFLKITLKLDLGGDVFIVALYDHDILEMIKIKVTGTKTYKWLGTKIDDDPKKQCLKEKTFTTACFKGEDKEEGKYKVHLNAEKEKEKEKDDE